MKLKTFLTVLICFSLFLPQLAQAHFIWLVSATGENSPEAIHLYFGELAEADDPELLDRVESAQIWQLNAEGKKVDLKSAKGEESIVATPAIKEGPSIAATAFDYGILERGGSAFVLRYYAKTVHKNSAADWNKIDSAEHLALDITPERTDEFQIKLTVKWQNKPLANAELKLEDDLGNYEAEATTDENGQFSFPTPKSNILSIRTKHVEEKEGELDGTKYTSIRHYSTLALPLK